MTILGLDPGFAIIGFGLINSNGYDFQEIRHGIISTPAHTPMPDRLESIYDDLCVLLEGYKPDAVALEELFFNTNITTGIQVAQARGVIILACKKCGVPIFEYTPLQVKQAVVGYGRAEKKQVMEMTRILLKLNAIPKPDDAADALAMALCHAYSAGSALGKL